MASNKRLTDLTEYTSVLPFDSELFGIYQPLIGWKSKLITNRFAQGLKNDQASMLQKFYDAFPGKVALAFNEDCQVDIRMSPASFTSGEKKRFDSLVMEKIAEKLPPYEAYRRDIWGDLINPHNMEIVLHEFITPAYREYYFEKCRNLHEMIRSTPQEFSIQLQNALAGQLKYESSVAGALVFLSENERYVELEDLFYKVQNNKKQAEQWLQLLSAATPQQAYLNIDNLNPRDLDHINSAALSPIAVVHLFRQYFFELDSFLGTPVSHVWLSPGSTVELIEVHTRKTIVEKSLETILETTTKMEKSVTEEEEFTDAVKRDNREDIKFGASVTASYASITATSSFDYNNSQQTAREESHRKMRQQTEKIASEIRKSFKSTFKTISEITDTSSKRYVLANDTKELINYELRRKMRQVGVQVQDVGTYLCWQTYVDDPGDQLGLANLIHVAKPADLGGIPNPEEILPPEAFTSPKDFTIPFRQTSSSAGDKDEWYERDGTEVDTDFNEGQEESIQTEFLVTDLNPPKSGYFLSDASIITNGAALKASRSAISSLKGDGLPPYQFTLYLDSVNFQGKDSINIRFDLHWEPFKDTLDKVKAENDAKRAQFEARKKEEMDKVYIENVRERIKVSSKITSRKSDELREEERIVVYRKLIQELLTKGVPMPNDTTRHIVAELINNIFDVDKMLYFVAPEWWRPRLHRSGQQLDESSLNTRNAMPALHPNIMALKVQKSISNQFVKAGQKLVPAKLKGSSVSWGGLTDRDRDNYMITEDSEPAKMGSSLGWLLQLDGDNMRNAFLNAPWVKAVIPIRPGKEEAALNWLKGVEGMNGITDDVIYHASNPNEKDINGNPLEGQKMIDVLLDLAKKIKRKHAEGMATGKYPKPGEIDNPELMDEANTVTATPIDRVYEHGFYPLQGGFRANVSDHYQVFDQWIEVLPTDQIVPVPVKYNSKTGRQE